MHKDLTTDVAVIGAGLAGLVAAHDLADRGGDVVVLEARERVGGRLLNDTLPGGEPIEVGGQWVGPGQDRILSLIKSLNLRTHPTHVAGDHIAEIGSTRSRYQGRVPKVNPLVLADIAQTQWRLDRTARRVARGEPRQASGAEALDGQTFGTWLARHAHTAAGRAYFRLLTQALFSAEPEDLSALWSAYYIGTGGGLDTMISSAGGAQQDRVVGGSQQIAIALAEQLGDRVNLDAPVAEIDWSDSEVRIEARGVTVRARRVIITVPPPLAVRIRFTPGLPADRDQLTQRMPMGRVIKINVAYDEPFWRMAGLSGQANSTIRPLGTVFDNSPPGGSPGVLVGFLEGRHADAGARMQPADRRARVLTDLVDYFGPRAAHPIAYIERDWADEEYSRGCYGAFGTPGALTRFGHTLRAPIGPLHWAGTETATRWAGYMDGAVESGQRAAQEIAGHG